MDPTHKNKHEITKSLRYFSNIRTYRSKINYSCDYVVFFFRSILIQGDLCWVKKQENKKTIQIRYSNEPVSLTTVKWTKYSNTAFVLMIKTLKFCVIFSVCFWGFYQTNYPNQMWIVIGNLFHKQFEILSTCAMRH